MIGKKQRLVGLDILKILSAIMIVVLHFNGYSGNLLIKSAQTRELFITANLLEAFCICSVNVFVIISCYISIKATKVSVEDGIYSAFFVWVQTICVTVPLAVILLVVGVAEFSFSDLLRSVLPFSTRTYWFITTFVCFRLLLPLLNRSVNAMHSRSLLYLSVVLVLVYSAIPTVFEIFGWQDVQHGYSLVWFITLYYCTAFLVKSNLIKRIPVWISSGAYVISSFLIFLSVLVIWKVGGVLSGRENYIIRNYASIPVLVQAFSLFLCFTGVNLKENTKAENLVSVLASGSLMSYILHMHPMLKTIYGSEEINRLFPTSALPFALCCLVVAVVVFLLGVLVYQVLKKPIQRISDFLADRANRIIRMVK